MSEFNALQHGNKRTSILLRQLLRHASVSFGAQLLFPEVHSGLEEMKLNSSNELASSPDNMKR